MCCSSCGLQVEHEAANNRQQAETFELKHQLNRLNSLIERGNQALQQKTHVRNVPLHLRTVSNDLQIANYSQKSEEITPKHFFFLHRTRKPLQG